MRGRARNLAVARVQSRSALLRATGLLRGFARDLAVWRCARLWAREAQRRARVFQLMTLPRLERERPKLPPPQVWGGGGGVSQRRRGWCPSCAQRRSWRRRHGVGEAVVARRATELAIVETRGLIETTKQRTVESQRTSPKSAKGAET